MTMKSYHAGGTADLQWWQKAVFYQVYPRSFQDSNGDGIGDLQGIINRLDYLVALGIDAVWISPIFPSPMVDFGYDVADYRDIDPMFGDLETFDRLLAVVPRMRTDERQVDLSSKNQGPNRNSQRPSSPNGKYFPSNISPTRPMPSLAARYALLLNPQVNSQQLTE
jgi:hypothetical protein